MMKHEPGTGIPWGDGREPADYDEIERERQRQRGPVTLPWQLETALWTLVGFVAVCIGAGLWYLASTYGAKL